MSSGLCIGPVSMRVTQSAGCCHLPSSWPVPGPTLSSTGSGRAGAGAPCPPHESVCESVYACEYLCTAWGKAWGRLPSWSLARAPHTAPRPVQAGPCHRSGPGTGLVDGGWAQVVQMQGHKASSWPGRATVAQCPG